MPAKRKPRNGSSRAEDHDHLGMPQSGILKEFDTNQENLSSEDIAKLIEFLTHPSTPEGKARRYQSLIRTLASIGDDISRTCGLVDGALPPQCPALVREASNISPFRPLSPRPLEPAQLSESEVTSSDVEQSETNESSERAVRVQKQASKILNACQEPPKPRKSRTSGIPLRISPEKETSFWKSSWEQAVTVAFGPITNHPTWLSDITALLEQVTSTICMAKIVSLANEIYESKIVFHLYQSTKTEKELRASEDAARDVALRFKELWSKHESDVVKEWAELYRYLELGRALMKLMIEVADKRSTIGKAFLQSRLRGSRRKVTETAMNTFIIAHLMSILDIAGDKDTLEQARRRLKRQRMTAMNVLLFVEVFGEGILLQLLGTRWSAIFPQFSYRSIVRPMIALASKHPEFRVIARLAEVNIAFYTKDKTRISQLPRQAIMAQSINAKQYRSYSMLELLSRPGTSSQMNEDHEMARNSPVTKLWILDSEVFGHEERNDINCRPNKLPRLQQPNDSHDDEDEG